MLILWGVPNTGKTELAKALLGPVPLIATQLDELKKWDPDLYSGIVYDEVSLLHLPREQQIHHCDVTNPVAIYARYQNAYLTADRGVIFTCNPHPSQVILFNDAAIRRRVQVVHVLALNTYEPWDLDTSGPIGLHSPQPGSTTTAPAGQYTLVE